MTDPIPSDLRTLFDETADLDGLLGSLVERYARAIGADRCLLFLYEPTRRLSRCTHAWQARPEWSLAERPSGWTPLPEDLPEQDPMFAEALVNPRALYIDDIETAGPDRVNAPYEREHFGHHSLIHAPLLEDGLLWGILEPCTMAAPRTWTASDRAITEWVQEQLLPIAKRYVARFGP